MSETRRIALGIEYCGTAFAGWQSQPHGHTVQDVLETALGRIAGHPVRVQCAGRTDAGVHALMQVAHFDTAAIRPLSAWVRGANSWLPDTVAVRWAAPVEADFHARFCAEARAYRYVLFNHPVRPALASGRAGWYHRVLDAARMHEAAQRLLGEHDFSAFRAAQCQARTPVKVLQYAKVSRISDYIVLEFRATAFLHHMVRNLVGALVMVGKGAQDGAWLTELLASRNRSLAPSTFSPDGLYFAGAQYDARWRLPEAARIIAPLPLGLL